jgi:hypothetical protein
MLSAIFSLPQPRLLTHPSNLKLKKSTNKAYKFSVKWYHLQTHKIAVPRLLGMKILIESAIWLVLKDEHS